VTAEDEDEGDNGLISYRLAEASLSAYGNAVCIDGASGDILVAGSIDFEARDRFTLRYVCVWLIKRPLVI